MTDGRLALIQLRADQRSFWRNPFYVFFTVIQPVIFLVIFVSVFGNDTTVVAGHLVKRSTYYVPGILTMAIVSATFFNLTISLTRLRERGILKRVRSTPLPPWMFLAGRVGSCVVVSVLLVALIMGIGRLAYGVTVPADAFAGIAAALVVGAGSFCCLAFALCSVVPSEDAAAPMTNVIVLPLFFLSGIFIPTTRSRRRCSRSPICSRSSTSSRPCCAASTLSGPARGSRWATSPSSRCGGLRASSSRPAASVGRPMPISHPERHLGGRAGWLRASVLGANDGIVSTASLVLGVASSGASRSAIVTAGIAGLVAGALSMAAGEYVSVSSQRDAEEADLRLEERELREDPSGELRELAAIYESRGLPPQLASDVADALTDHGSLEAHARDELGLAHERRARPLQAAWASALSFSAGAILPLLAVALAPSGARIAVAVVRDPRGAGRAGPPRCAPGWRAPGRAVVRVVAWGAIAMGVTAAIGALVGGVV